MRDSDTHWVWVEGELPAEARATETDRRISEHALQSVDELTEVTPTRYRRMLRIAVDFDPDDDTSVEVVERLEYLLRMETVDIDVRRMHAFAGEVIADVRSEVRDWADWVVSLLTP